MDYLTNDCLHDVDTPIPMLHASATSSCHDLPIYDEYDDEHVELPSCDAMLHRISCENSIGHFMFDNPLNLSYAMSEISHIASFQSQHRDYACPGRTSGPQAGHLAPGAPNLLGSGHQVPDFRPRARMSGP